MSKTKLIRVGEYVVKRLDELRTRHHKTYSYDTVLHLLLYEYDEMVRNRK